MKWHSRWCVVFIWCLCLSNVHSDTSEMDSNLAMLAQGGINDLQLPGLHGPLPGNRMNQRTEMIAKMMTDFRGNPIPNLSMNRGPMDVIVPGNMQNFSPPMVPNKFLTLPQFPVGFVNFQANHSKHKITATKQTMGYISVPPGSPVDFVKVPNWTSGIPPQGPVHEHAIGLVVNGPVLEGKPPPMQLDRMHHLPMNHLFVPVPITHLNSQEIGGPGPAVPPAPTVADILIVIDASESMGHIDAGGRVVWNPNIVDFLNKFIQSTPMGPEANRIGVVVVSHGIDDMIALSNDKKFLIDSLNLLRPSFRGGCTEKGITTASSLFYQYGRQLAVKRIVLLTGGAGKCPYRNMAEIMYARKCGIDFIHVGFGPAPTPKPDPGYQSHWNVAGLNKLISVAEPVARRAYIDPIHGGWSHWSDWNLCSATGTCSLGYQMRFRLCDNPKPAYGGQTCHGLPAQTRMCHMRPCIDNAFGHWTRWTEFTPCSSPCGIGSKTRTRTCMTLGGEPSATCPGKYVEVAECIVKACPVDGSWSLWSEWGLCSVTCGVGMKMRARQCDSPAPKHGGKPCQGLAVEESICDTGLPCPIHGGYGPWSPPEKCDALCGEGLQRYTRECNNPLPQYGGLPCKGEMERFEPCDTGIPCPIHGHWGLWSIFSECSAKCEIGFRKRERLCDSPPPAFGGNFCEGPPIDEQNCDTGIPCPIHGQWSSWSDFSKCSVKCGIGSSKRFRLCNSPSPMYGGMDCVGLAVDESECDTGIMCPIDGGWSKWSQYSFCNVDCGRGFISRTRTCTNPVPLYGGAFCVGLEREEKECDSGVSCPVHGFWSHWLPWGSCSAACGLGFRQRLRFCNNPTPKFGGLECDGSALDKETCDTRIPCPVDGGWSEWSLPHPCSVPCGVGTTKRVRVCDSPIPLYGGADCIGPDTEILECDTKTPCPIHGKWTLWSKWSMCDADCGTSVQNRIRMCDNPPPMFGGLPCEGPDFEDRPCDTGIPCPVHGDWSLWTVWSQCSEICGVGYITRTRACNNPAPKFGGKICIGIAYEEMPCETGVMCPIDGAWSPWSDLSSCSVTCGIGVMNRKRVCDNPPPQFNGLPCVGAEFEEMPCDTAIPCPVHGNWGHWSEFTHCDVKCGIGMKSRSRECNSPAALFGGTPCVGPAVDNVPCDTGVFCPVNGEWGPWSLFTQCNRQCGIGIVQRTRICNNPEPLYGGQQCEGFDIEEKICDTGINCPVDGHWGPWGVFTQCSVKCGIGNRQRMRECNNPPPLYGGGDCAGIPLEIQECDTGIPCPIDGGWTIWSKFGICSVDCGIGVQKRERYCSNPVPLYGGLDCIGPSIDTSPCDTGINCPIHGSWTPWGGWSGCSVDCGIGLSIRRRECANPPPMYGGLPCKGFDMEEMTCDTGINCPIHGGWSLWGEYSKCSVTCGVGTMQRNRVCDSPIPQYGGKMCIGESTEGTVCDTQINCPIDGGFSMWLEWSSCSAVCGEGMQFRTRLCDSPAPLYGGIPCKGIFREERICDTGIFCPIHGNWGEWTSYTPCSVSCGKGFQERSRLCDNPAPMYGGQLCKGFDLDTIMCDTGIYCPVDGEWSIWAAWTGCSVLCGVGVQKRTRSCTNPEPMFGGLLCKGNPLQEQVCNTGIPCPINGEWSFWSDWLPCDVACGVGTHSRVRTCDNPPPQYGGLQCSGPAEEDTVCDTGIPCPVMGNWSPWSIWSECTATCEIGMQQRMRTCTNPPPKYGGDMCPGIAEEVRDCDTNIFCPIDGHWAPWTKWTHCSTSCGIGIHARTRTCINPPPAYGGQYCIGPQDEKADCDTGIPCPIDGNWGSWSMYSKCDVLCGIGIQTRTRECNNPAPMFGGNICFGGNTEDMPCDSGVLCPIDGGWSDWSQFTICSVPCGVGSQERVRTCTNPMPQFGGLDCAGLAVEVVKCDSGVHCPIDGAWSSWYVWSPCYGDCGMGKRERRRECNNPAPNFGGLPCAGPDIMTDICDTTVHCPIPGGWSDWSPPSLCSVSCGIGVQTRVRNCNNPLPQYGGPDCVGPTEEIMECNTLIECPIDGNWGAWSSYGQCNVKCGVGLHTRVRECNMPPPQYGGRNCVGMAIEETKCDTNIKCAIHGGWSFWSPWSECQASCGVGEKVRVRVCNNPSPLYGGLMCNGPDAEVISCETGVPCPIDGGWTFWSDWDLCSVSCGIGTQNRYRECSAPLPMYGGIPCSGLPIETQNCATGVSCPIDGRWTHWSLWSACSVTCDIGVRSRERFCDNPPPQFGGATCAGVPEEIEKCDTGVPCPIHGSWSVWTPWSGCMADCAIGQEIRSRVCNNPAPMFGGMECEGLSEDIRNCDTGVPCPINGNWGEWMGWSMCMADCGLGERTRIRECNNPPPQFGGIPCKGFAEQIDVCDTMTQCPIHGQWSLWSKFTMCSTTCNMGIQTRTRTCSEPPPQFGGLPCKGSAEDLISCDTGIACPINGNWGQWYPWSKCSVTCGVGEMERHRDCNNPIPQYGGLPCDGPSFELGPCDTKTLCPVHGNWGEWSAYTACAGECGIGIQERQRFCNNPPPQYGGNVCIGPDIEVLECDTEMPCAINGQWGSWMPWGECNVYCGFGMHSRVRKCDSPPPQFGGLDCPGPQIEEKKCDSLINCAVHGGWSYWSEWSICSSSCAIGAKVRHRQCTNPRPLYGGQQCAGPAEEVIDCDSGVPCPINGQWGAWLSWSTCSGNCGIGTKERVRQCSAPHPQYGGMPCEGPIAEVADCDTGVECAIDGHWSLWSSWSDCNKDCGLGFQSRTRVCNNPPPAFGGMKCGGFGEELRQCDTGISCAIDGNWGMWSEFTVCSANCGFGIQERFRICNNPTPRNGGMDCEGPAYEEVKCDSLVPCPIDGGWSLWSMWTNCDAKCGIGIRERWRQCTQPVPKYGGQTCFGPQLEIVDCDSKVPCSVDGNWSPWTKWDVCSATCGVGYHHRYRTCSNPRPSLGGKLCDGVPEEKQTCDTGTPCPVDGSWSFWSDWSICDAKCGVGYQLRVRTCSNPAPMFGGQICLGIPQEKTQCDTGVPCPIHGGWSLWSGWDKCDVTCGKGMQNRIRTCTNPRPQFGGMVCLGIPQERRHCDTGVPCSINGNWGTWGVWAKCDAVCGIGNRRRMRFCDSPPPQMGGLTCPGLDWQEEVCDTGVPCNRPGGWSMWGHWGLCSVTCGIGIKVRERVCNNPPPLGPGMECRGNNLEKTRCDTGIACAINGGWTKWSVFGACMADCSNGVAASVGYKIRRRYCENPFPMNGGLPCGGLAVERVQCFDFPPCAEPEWALWTKWTKCSEECGPGHQERTRACLDTSTGRTIDQCMGIGKETQPCKVMNCPTAYINCSTECKWDNGIGYAEYPGDCSMFVQCDSIDGIPVIQDCAYGLLWSLNILQCVYPAQSECDMCAGAKGRFKSYHISCRAYWDCTLAVPEPKCCAENEWFNPFTHQCEFDATGTCTQACPPKEILPPEVCIFKSSPRGSGWYQQEINGVWRDRPCGAGTVFSDKECQCIYYTDGFLGPKTECTPELHLSFNTLQEDLDRNIGLHVENVTYLGDGTAYFDGKAAINDNIFSNSEWGQEVYVYIRFKPEGEGRSQGLVHNSGCGPSDIGPSVFIGMDRQKIKHGNDVINMKFATVPKKKALEYDFVNITTPADQMIDAWFKFGKGQFVAEVNGLTATLDIPGASAVARRHGALNIGGNLCKIGNESFGGFVGILDEVMIYKCKPTGHF